MTRPFKLEREARSFAQDLSGVLNGTVCSGVKLNHVMAESGAAFIGHKITRQQLSRVGGFELGGRSHSGIFMSMSYQLTPDDSSEYLTVRSSFVGLSTDSAGERELLHFDYERDKPNGYPEAHMQIAATSPEWGEVLGKCGKSLSALHLPVGGRRFRPTLEDILEFLIVEGLVVPVKNWHATLTSTREEFQIKQLRAAIRRYPEQALKAYRELHGPLQ